MRVCEAILALGLSLLLGAPNLQSQAVPGSPAAIPADAALTHIPPTSPHPAEGPQCEDFAQADSTQDSRVRAVRDYLWSNGCAIDHLAGTFVRAADLNGIDYRLLPVLAVHESGCGRKTRNHNLFGWANGRKAFASFEQAIHFVAQRLRLAPHYAGKSTLGKLRMYNRRGSYRAKILRAMDTIVPEPPLETTPGGE